MNENEIMKVEERAGGLDENEAADTIAEEFGEPAVAPVEDEAEELEAEPSVAPAEDEAEELEAEPSVSPAEDEAEELEAEPSVSPAEGEAESEPAPGKKKRRAKPRSKAGKIVRGILVAILCSIVATVLFVVIAGSVMFGDVLGAMKSISKPFEGQDVYYMEFYGDYGFEGFLEQGGVSSDGEIADYFISFISKGTLDSSGVGINPGDYGCSAISLDDGHGATLFGRNYDWSNDDSLTMICVTKPDGGYNSISTVDLSFLGYGADYRPDELSSKFVALAAPYVPLDGVNEKGLCVADLMVDGGAPTAQETDKPDLTTTTAIRLLLDKAATVDEAVEMLGQYDMHSSIGAGHHLAISDAEGGSIVVEWVDNEMIVTETHVVTNGYVCEQGALLTDGGSNSVARFGSLLSSYEANRGELSAHGLSMVMESVSQKNMPGSFSKTRWTVLFDTKAITATYYFAENYEKAYFVSFAD